MIVDVYLLLIFLGLFSDDPQFGEVSVEALDEHGLYLEIGLIINKGIHL